jgi:hypothetical protein
MRIFAVTRAIWLLLLGIFINGCATLDKDECLTANWETIGYEDGSRGLEASRIGQHRSACAEYGVTPNLAQYTQGRERGLQQYCRASVGYNVGVNGNRYLNVCPKGSEREFLMGYRYGQNIYQTQSRLRSLKSKVKTKEATHAEILLSIEQTEAELIRTGVTPARRKILLDELKALSADKQEYEALLNELYAQIEQASVRMHQLQKRNPYQ